MDPYMVALMKAQELLQPHLGPHTPVRLLLAILIRERTDNPPPAEYLKAHRGANDDPAS